jgi:hypothetical protein
MPMVSDGSYAHITGTFDLEHQTGTIDYVTPVKIAVESTSFAPEDIWLRGRDIDGKQLFQQAVRPQRNSCAPHAAAGTYDEYVPAKPELQQIELVIKEAVAARFKRGPKTQGAVVMGAADPASPHRLPVQASDAPPATGVTYTVQAKAEHDKNWQTIAVGLKTPTTEVDVNQFPGAKGVNIRVLQSDGFSEKQIFENTKTF